MPVRRIRRKDAIACRRHDWMVPRPAFGIRSLRHLQVRESVLCRQNRHATRGAGHPALRVLNAWMSHVRRVARRVTMQRQSRPTGPSRRPSTGACRQAERHMASKTTNPFTFLQQVRAETAKVTWPSRRETMISTVDGRRVRDHRDDLLLRCRPADGAWRRADPRPRPLIPAITET